MKTVAEVRKAFWEEHPQFMAHYKKGKKHNEYNGDITFAFSCFVDALGKSNQISESLRYRVTL